MGKYISFQVPGWVGPLSDCSSKGLESGYRAISKSAVRLKVRGPISGCIDECVSYSISKWAGLVANRD